MYCKAKKLVNKVINFLRRGLKMTQLIILRPLYYFDGEILSKKLWLYIFSASEASKGLLKI